MLKIENLKKIQGKTVFDNWVVKEVGTLEHNNTYYFGVYGFNEDGVAIDRCKIMLERTPITQRSMTHPDETAYFFICDSQRTNVCGTVNWLSDMDNMLGVMKGLITTTHINN